MENGNESPEHGSEWEGWWEQEGYGRQPMTNLIIGFDGNEFAGLGMDIIGPFALHGEISHGGQVTIGKSYILAHTIRYEGTFDGEGTMSGIWTNGSETGRWMLSLKRDLNSSLDGIQEILP